NTQTIRVFHSLSLMFLIQHLTSNQPRMKSSVCQAAMFLCSMSTKIIHPEIFFSWYQQYPGKPPQFLISHLGSESVLNNPVPGLKIINVTEKQIHLIISSAAVSDSAVYYCAVRPTVTGNTQSVD
uniref:Ig-like domain-containing protein n=1 Tax=Salarias fasciatus TaxID=181472 RepID=A0A672HY19_SALFA